MPKRIAYERRVLMTVRLPPPTKKSVELLAKAAGMTTTKFVELALLDKISQIKQASEGVGS